MAAGPVILPEAGPNDDEDVVWGLSTATALWARGERGDAIVWLRRAADSAAAAGQEARGLELRSAAVQLALALEDHVRRTMPPPAPRAAVETLPDTTGQPGPDAPSEAEPDAEPAEPEPETPPARLAPVRPASVPPPVATLPPVAFTPPVAVPAAAPLPVVAAPPAVAPAPPAAAAPPAGHAPSGRPGSIAPPPPPVINRPASIVPPSPPPPRGPLPSYTFVGLRPSPRAPILDPWAEEQTMPSMRVDPALRQISLEGDEVMVHMRRPTVPRNLVDDEDVVTSAAPLDVTLRRASRPPPARKATSTGEQPPGHIADAPVPSKTAARPPPPLPARGPSSDAGRVAPSGPPSAPETVPSTRSVPPPRPPSIAPAAAASASAGVAALLAAPAPAPSAAPPSSPPAATASAIDAPTMPSTPSPLARARAAQPPPVAPVPPPEPSAPAHMSPILPPAPTVPRIPSPFSAPRPGPSSSASSSSFRSVSTVSVRPPASAPTSVRPPAPASSPASTSSGSLSPTAPTSAAPTSASPVSVRPPAPRPRPASSPPRPPPPRPAPAFSLDGVSAFAVLTPEGREQLATLARVESLGADEEVKGFGAAVVLEGAAMVCATVADSPLAPAAKGMLLATRGSSGEPIALRVVATAEGARVGLWDAPVIESALEGSPGALHALRAHADRLQALAAVTLGLLHDLEDDVRFGILERLQAQVLRPREAIVAMGAALPGVMVVCAGAVEVGDDDDGARLVRPGELLFAREGRAGAFAPAAACASAAGAVLLIGDAGLAAELATLPTLSRLFAI